MGRRTHTCGGAGVAAWPIAQTKPQSSRASAVITTVGFLPPVLSWRLHQHAACLAITGAGDTARRTRRPLDCSDGTKPR